jgi:hypothetical protein
LRGACVICNAAAQPPPPPTEAAVFIKSERSSARRRRRQGRKDPAQEGSGADPLADRVVQQADLFYAQHPGFDSSPPEPEQIEPAAKPDSSTQSSSSAVKAARGLQRQAGQDLTASDVGDTDVAGEAADQAEPAGLGGIGNGAAQENGGFRQRSATGQHAWDAGPGAERAEEAGARVVDPDVVLSDEAQAVCGGCIQAMQPNYQMSSQLCYQTCRLALG